MIDAVYFLPNSNKFAAFGILNLGTENKEFAEKEVQIQYVAF